MPDPVTGTIGAVSAGGSILGNREARKGASRAADAQVQAALAGIDEGARQFDVMRDLLNPYVEAGASALEQQQQLLTPQGYQQVLEDPITQALIEQQEEALLQNAAATGQLRGGNTQAALAELRPALIQSQLQQRFSNLGGLAGMGQASAAGVGSAALQTGANTANLLQQSGAAQAGSQLANAQARQRVFGDIGDLGIDFYKLDMVSQNPKLAPILGRGF